MEQQIIRPQEGYQMEALASAADIVIGGGAAGVGKTWTMLVEPLRHVDVKGFGTVVFRRTYPEIRAEGGLWDASQNIYGKVTGAHPNETFMEWRMGESKLKFAALQHEKDVYKYQGSEIPLIEFDELTHFTKKMFFYMLTRNRSTCGVKPYVRATCNPDPDSWVAELIAWWIDQETGFPIPERCGVLRYFIVHKENYIWGDTRDEVLEQARHILQPMAEASGLDPRTFIKSITFIGGSIYDNKALLSVNADYLANLNSQPEEIRSQLLEGNWKVKTSDIDLFEYYKFLDMRTNVHAKRGARYISADIAAEGSNKFVVFVWEGNVLIDFAVYDKSDGPAVINGIKGMAAKHRVPYSNIVFDADGVGQLVGSKDAEKGFIPGARQFNGGAAPLPDPVNPIRDKNNNPLPENYSNIKSQCFYRTGKLIDAGEIYIPPEVGDRPYDENRTLWEQLKYERKAIKRGKDSSSGKLRLIGKEEMKIYLSGQSPDLMDALAMREVFRLVPVRSKPKARF